MAQVPPPDHCLPLGLEGPEALANLRGHFVPLLQLGPSRLACPAPRMLLGSHRAPQGLAFLPDLEDLDPQMPLLLHWLQRFQVFLVPLVFRVIQFPP
jgi:hypothetical protein